MSVWSHYDGTLSCEALSPRGGTRFNKRLEELGVEDPFGREGIGDEWYGLHILAAVSNYETRHRPCFPFDAGASTVFGLEYNYPDKPGTMSCAPIPPVPAGSEGIGGELVQVTWAATCPYEPGFLVHLHVHCRDRELAPFSNYIQMWMDVLWAWTALSGTIKVSCLGEVAMLHTPDRRYEARDDTQVDYDQIAAYIIKMWCDIQNTNRLSTSKHKYDFQFWWNYESGGTKYEVEHLDTYVNEHCHIKDRDETDED